MTPRQKELARHALGLDNPDARKRSYRNRYICGFKSPGFTAWMRMVRDGNAVREPFGSYTYDRFMFSLTAAGAQAALEKGESLDTEDFPSLKMTG